MAPGGGHGVRHSRGGIVNRRSSTVSRRRPPTRNRNPSPLHAIVESPRLGLPDEGGLGDMDQGRTGMKPVRDWRRWGPACWRRPEDLTVRWDRRQDVGYLTPRERGAGPSAHGASNADAQELVIAVKTVEVHVGNALKLDLSPDPPAPGGRGRTRPAGG
jgi:hypothetical protein